MYLIRKRQRCHKCMFGLFCCDKRHGRIVGRCVETDVTDLLKPPLPGPTMARWFFIGKMVQIIARLDFSSSKKSCMEHGICNAFASRYFVFELGILVSRTTPDHHQPISPKADSFPVHCAGGSKFLASTPTPASVLLCELNAPNWVHISLRAPSLCISFCCSTVVAASPSAVSTCSATRSTSCISSCSS